jgi:hypothetical protein
VTSIEATSEERAEEEREERLVQKRLADPGWPKVERDPDMVAIGATFIAIGGTMVVASTFFFAFPYGCGDGGCESFIPAVTLIPVGAAIAGGVGVPLLINGRKRVPRAAHARPDIRLGPIGVAATWKYD